MWVVTLIVGIIIGAIFGTLMAGIVCNDILKRKDGNKFIKYYEFYGKWLNLLIHQKSISENIKQKGYQRVCVYGMAEIGKKFIDELQSNGVTVACALDRRRVESKYDFNVYCLKDIAQITEQFDVIIVTAFPFFDDIKEQIKNDFSCKILSIEEFL